MQHGGNKQTDISLPYALMKMMHGQEKYNIFKM
jgi:hypothetical protein